MKPQSKPVSFQDCKAELLDKAGPLGIEAYRKWRNRPDGQDVVKFVEGFTHSHLFAITTETLRAVMTASGHALGDVKKEERLPFIEDFTCPFALQHIFHGYIETRKEVPTWETFYSYIREGAAPLWMDQLRVLLRNCPTVKAFVKTQGQGARDKINRAVRWRLGKFYLSAMRELDLFTRLREKDAPVSYHLLADVLLRVDFWSGNILICCYFGNPAYWNGVQGRKPPAKQFFKGSEHPFHIKPVPIDRQGFGNFWLASDDAVAQLLSVLS